MNKLGFNSICSREKHTTKPIRSHQLPIYPTSSFRFDSIEQGMDVFLKKKDEHLYSRYGNPTVDAVADKIAALEAHGTDLETQAYLTSSGMAAISTVLISLMKSGDKILVPENIYGGTTVLIRDVLEPLGLERVSADFKDLNVLETFLKSDKAIKVLYFETPTNPTLSCVDIEKITSLAHQYGKKVVIDNTFCTPYLQQPFKFGIDFIIHSTTKYLNGHGTSTSGIIIGHDVDFMKTVVFKRMIMLGTNCNPFDAWMLNNGLKTLALRMDRHSSNAQTVAEYLEKHPKVAQVNYPGLANHPDYDLAKRQMRLSGGMLSFELKDGFDAAVQFMNSVELCTIAPTLGDVDTLLMHPASMSHLGIPKEIREANGITDGLVRISVGIEDIEDILADLKQALK